MSSKTAGSKNVRRQIGSLAYDAISSQRYGGPGALTKAQEFGRARNASREIGRSVGNSTGIRRQISMEQGAVNRQAARDIIKQGAAMDRELAGVIIQKWEDGDPVSETNLYKAAQALDINPIAALVEARFFTYFDNYLTEKRAMSHGERVVFSAAASMNDRVMTKTASSFGFSPDELIVEALRERGFVPDIVKIANLSAVGGDPTMMDPAAAMAAQQGGGQAPPVQQQAGDAMMGPPQPGAMLQQQPQARFKPSPTAPEQAPPSPMGNLDELIAQGQQTFGPQATENGGTAPAGMPQPAPPPPSPEERVQQVGPNLDPETVSRYAEQLQRFEEGFGMQVADPKQMVKFVKELQKIDGKKVDQGIKAMGQQLEQEQAQELGVDANPTIDGGMGGGQQVMAPKQQPPGGAGGPPGAQENPQQGAQASPQKPPAQAESAPMGETGQTGAGEQQMPPNQQKQPPRPQQKSAPPGQQQAAQEAAVEKVANAARALARAAHQR